MRVPTITGLVLACALAGCGGGGGVAPQSIGSLPTGHATRQYFIGISLARAIASSTAAGLLNGTQPFVNIDAIATTPGSTFDYSSVPAAWNAIPLVRYASEADLEANIGQLPSTVRVVMLDIEPDAAPPTPPEEVANPGPYYARAASVVHASGRLFYPTAGLTVPSQNPAVFATAGAWDYYGIQSQTREADLPGFENEIAGVTAAVHAVNPRVIMAAGIGDYSQSTLAPLNVIAAAQAAVPAGYPIWLNFGPHPNIPADAALAISLITSTAAQ